MEHIRPTATTASGALAELRRTVRHLLLARSLRDFADGFVAILLPVYLTGARSFAVRGRCRSRRWRCWAPHFLHFAFGFLGPGTTIASFCSRRRSLMIATGVAFSMVDAYAVILVVAFAGTVNPSVGSVSLFVPLEQAVLTREVSSRRAHRGCSPATSLIGAAGRRRGSTRGRHAGLCLTQIGFGRMAALKAMFVLYALIGLAGAFVYARIPARPQLPQERPAAALRPSGHIVYKLAALSCLDAFAGGFVVQSLLALWLFERFDMSLTAAGSLLRLVGDFVGLLVSSGRLGCRAASASSIRWCSRTSRRAFS